MSCIKETRDKRYILYGKKEHWALNSVSCVQFSVPVGRIRCLATVLCVAACLQRPYIVETMHSYTLPM